MVTGQLYLQVTSCQQQVWVVVHSRWVVAATHTERERDRERQTETDRQTDRQTGRDRQREVVVGTQD